MQPKSGHQALYTPFRQIGALLKGTLKRHVFRLVEKDSTCMSKIVIALGGNALLPADQVELEQQRQRVQKTIQQLAPIREDGYEIVLAHGNGPQVGTLMLENEKAGVQHAPLDVLVAETQGQIGYHLQQAWYSEFGEPATTIVTQVRVDEDDEAFDNPTKPVGPYYTPEEAAEKDFPTMEVDADGEATHRRVVASPEPQEIVETPAINRALDAGTSLISVGGGGIPVIKKGSELEGIPAVIDKDKASQVLAGDVGADEFMVLTDVDAAYVNYGTPEEEALGETTVEELREYLDAGEFGVGSMGPKVESIVRFIEAGGERGIITSLDKAAEALSGEAGTQVVQ